ncbi:MAG: nitroreductase family protein [bacterium]
MLIDLVKKARSHRRFHEKVRLSNEFMRDLIEYARFSPSGMNKQPIRFILSNNFDKNEKVFSTLSWAAELRDWDGPEKGQRPAGYIIIVRDTNIVKNQNADGAIMMQSIFLAAAEKDIAGCMLASVDRKKLRKIMNIPEHYEIEYVLALGKSAETVIVDDYPPKGDLRYYRDKDYNHHVPKRQVDELILKCCDRENS